MSLDPDHLPAALAIVEAVVRRLPELPQVACFDTAFFAALPRFAQLLPLPPREGLRRYGFHGLSYTSLMAQLGPAGGRGRVVLAHLGSGASLAAVKDGCCIDTTMGFTPTSGLPMATRSGDLDPGVVLHLLRTGLDVDGVDALLNHGSGLLGVSGTSGDIRDLLAAEADDPRAADAIGLFCYQAKKAIGAFAAALGGLDTLVFAGGIGERSPDLRARIAGGLEHLGVFVDRGRNEAGNELVSTDGSRVAVRVGHTDEESVIARQTLAALTTGDAP